MHVANEAVAAHHRPDVRHVRSTPSTWRMVRIEGHGASAKVQARALPQLSVSRRRSARVVRDLFDPQEARVDDDLPLRLHPRRGVRRRGAPPAPGAADPRRRSTSSPPPARPSGTTRSRLVEAPTSTGSITRSTRARRSRSDSRPSSPSAPASSPSATCACATSPPADTARRSSPYFDWVLLRDHERAAAASRTSAASATSRTCRRPRPWDDVIAFDTGPGNMIIDELTGVATNGAQTYDIDGALGGAGTVAPELLAAWMSIRTSRGRRRRRPDASSSARSSRVASSAEAHGRDGSTTSSPPPPP